MHYFCAYLDMIFLLKYSTLVLILKKLTIRNTFLDLLPIDIFRGGLEKEIRYSYLSLPEPKQPCKNSLKNTSMKFSSLRKLLNHFQLSQL